jgi:purine-binding chemotaxis protein CheW
MNRVETREIQLVLFKLEGRYYGVDISNVTEMVDLQPLMPVFETPVYVEGMIDVRGYSVPVVDLRKRFHLAKAGRNADNRILVVNCNGRELGIIVDSICELLKVPAESIKLLDCIFIGEHLEHLLGVVRLKEKVVILMDMNTILSKSDYENLRAWNSISDEALC